MNIIFLFYFIHTKSVSPMAQKSRQNVNIMLIYCRIWRKKEKNQKLLVRQPLREILTEYSV